MLSKVMYLGRSQACLVGAEVSVSPATAEWCWSHAGIAPAAGITPRRRTNFLKKKFYRVSQRR